jgi:hypothetical protein
MIQNRFSSTTQLITLGETKTLVVGQAAIEHQTSRMFLSSKRETLSGAAGVTSTSSNNLGLYSYNITIYNSTTNMNETIIVTSISPSFTLPSNIFTSTNGPIVRYNYTTGDDGMLTQTVELSLHLTHIPYLLKPYKPHASIYVI